MDGGFTVEVAVKNIILKAKTVQLYKQLLFWAN
jgi:hypothetical protein